MWSMFSYCTLLFSRISRRPGAASSLSRRFAKVLARSCQQRYLRSIRPELWEDVERRKAAAGSVGLGFEVADSPCNFHYSGLVEAAHEPVTQ
jgi:hypothetical protein